MPDLFYLIGKWWKQILLLMVLAVATAVIVTLVQPTRYLSTATALPANPALTDKASIFNANIQSISSSMGSADELDVIVGTAQLDTVYLAVANDFNIWDHYKPEETGEAARIRSAAILKKNIRVIKSDFGELKVKAWDTDPRLAAELANAIMDKLNFIHQSIQNESNGAVLANLKTGRNKIATAIDSINIFLRAADITPEHAQTFTSRRELLTDQMQQYEKLIGQYQLIFDSKPSVLVTVERARPATRPDAPALWMILIATAFLSFLFGLLLALVMERRKTK